MGDFSGYIKFFRSVEDSPDFVGLRPDQAWVAIRIVQMANFKPGFMRFRGQAISVGRGELGHTLETIAQRTGATVKVVRTTIDRLVRSGFLGTRTGTVAGTVYRILVVRNYERFQGDDEEPGTVAGTTTGSDRAATGHETGSDRAPREEEEEGKKETTLAPSAAASAPPPSPTAGSSETSIQPQPPGLAGAATPDGHVRRGRPSPSPSLELIAEPVVATFPCVGDGPKEYRLTEAKARALAEAYPAVDVPLELKRARLWLEENPTRRKTASGMGRFLQSWMTRQQNSRPAGAPAPRPRETSLRRL